MTGQLVFVAVVAESFLVIGQLLLKRAMLLTNHRPVARRRFTALFTLAIAAMTIYFFLWLGLMGQHDLPLSQQYPFDALSLVLLVLATTLFLKEKLTPRAWAGIALVSAGLGLIYVSA